MSATDKRTLPIPVSEIFGPVIQGEGPLAGVATSFVRVAGCDYRCSWCDTPYAVLPELWSRTAERLLPLEIADRVSSRGSRWVTLSGGNPAMYNLAPLVDDLHQAGHLVSIETQGTLCPEWLRSIDQIVVSPKPPSAGMQHAAADFHLFCQNLERIGWHDPYRPPAMKVVVFDDADFLWAIEAYQASWEAESGNLGGALYLSVGTPPPVPDETLAGTRRFVCDRLAWLMDRVARYGGPHELVVLPQLHVLAYGHARGV